MVISQPFWILNEYRATVHREVAQLRRVITDQGPQVYEQDFLGSLGWCPIPT